MRYVKLGLSLAFFVPVFVMFGLAGWHGFWYGGVVGGMIGVFFGLVFGGAKGKWLDVFYPPGPDVPDATGRDIDGNQSRPTSPS